MSSNDELLLALIAASDAKPDCWKLAALLNTTYNSIECKIRQSLKVQAQALIQKAKDEGRMNDAGEAIREALPTGGKRAKGTGTCAKKEKNVSNGVASGRVTKSTKPKKPRVKKEAVDEDEDAADAMDGVNDA